MTVCLAAVCTYRSSLMVIGVSDRKYTAGNWTYEPPQTKRYALTDHVTLLISGDLSTNTSICLDAHRKLLDSPTQDIGEIAQIVALAFAEYRLKEAERSLLFPLGLNIHSYRQENETFVKRMDDQLRRWELEESIIIAGVDQRDGFAHLYIVSDPGLARCEDAAGFACIGSGSGHASADFMRAKYQRSWSIERALLLAYRAKKSAEVDPFVGTDTDMFIIGHGLATSPLNEDLFTIIETVHVQIVEAQRAALEEGDKDMEYYVKAFFDEQEEEAVQQEGIEAGDEPKQLYEGFEEDKPEDSSEE